MVKEYMNRPPTFKAIQYTEDNIEEVKAFVGNRLCSNVENPTQVGVTINNGRNIIFLNKGDYISVDTYGDFHVINEKYFNEFFMEVRSIQ